MNKIKRLILAVMFWALAVPGYAQVVSQGEPSDTTNAAAWPFKIVFGNAQIDPRDVSDRAGRLVGKITFDGAQAVTQSGAWAISFTAPQHVIVDSGAVTVTATDLDVRNLVFATDKADVTGSAVTVSDGSGALNVIVDSATLGTVTVTGPLTDTELRATPVPVSGSVTVSDGAGALNVIVDSGSVTANAGTNLNTSLLALESGGNLASLAGTVTSARAAVNPISGQAGVEGGAGTTTALTQRVITATDQGATIGPSTVIDADQEAITIALNGAQSAQLLITADTSAGSTFALESSSDGFVGASSRLVASINMGQSAGSITWVTNGGLTSAQISNGQVFDLYPSPGATHIRIRIALFGSGSTTGYFALSQYIPPPFLNPANRVIGGTFTLSDQVVGIGGTDVNSGLVKALPIAATIPTAGQNGIVTREVPGTTSSGTDVNSSVVKAIPIAATYPTSGQDGIVVRQVPDTSNVVSLSVNESVAAPTAATWYLKRQWALPASAHARPMRAFTAVTTAASRTLIAVINSLGTFNFSTNVFAATNSVASPFFYGRLFGCVTTVQSATATTLTVTYTDELGVSSTSGTGVFASASPVGNCFEFALGGSDVGARAVTNVTDTAAPTGVATIYGVSTLIESLGPAAVTDATLLDVGELNANEQMAILFIQAATTAQQRSAGVTLSLR